jgi:NADH:ubiquinone oxidoreductase subunit C
MNNVSIDSSLVEEFKAYFKEGLYRIENKAFGILVYINHMRIRDVALYLLDKGANFVNIVINDEGEKFELIYQFYFKIMETKFWFAKVLIDKQVKIDSIEIIYPHAKYIELELSKRYGLEYNRLTEDTEKELFAVPVSLYAKN